MSAQKNNRYTILCCIDGSDESYRGLRYATKFSLDHSDTDITLLYVRPEERSGAINLSVARENMLEWNIELPGMKSLKAARDVLVDLGFLGEEWQGKEIQKKSRGSRLGDNMIDYVSDKTGQHIRLKLRVASSVLTGILDEAHFYDYDLVIVSATTDDIGGAGHINLDTAVSVATEHDGTVILARELEEGHGHLVCLTSSKLALDVARKDAKIASRCGCPIHLYSVIEKDDGREAAEEMIAQARAAIKEMGYDVLSSDIVVGEPVWRIIEKGKEHSLIVLSATEKSTLKRMFMGSISRDVLRKAKNSVMIVR